MWGLTHSPAYFFWVQWGLAIPTLVSAHAEVVSLLSKLQSERWLFKYKLGLAVVIVILAKNNVQDLSLAINRKGEVRTFNDRLSWRVLDSPFACGVR